MAFIFQKVVNLQKDYIPNGGSSQYTVTQSICIHNASLSGQPDISLGSGTLKKGPKYWVCKKQGAKNRVIVIQKKSGFPMGRVFM